ncbi:acyltransferase [Micromonospora sp. NPDC049559]|uniref:acyltransferase family protein n=1 Tax=Micromonospora sp. NPDC049559 TaxID=3155923 RepID=UPI00342F3455
MHRDSLSTEAPRRLPSLTGLRFIAAALVFATHVVWNTSLAAGPFGDGVRRLFSLSGAYGVGFFFILSGFVLTWTARRGDTAGRFWRRRFVKIYPSHLVTFLLAGVLLVAIAQPIATVDWVASLLLVQAWFPDIGTSSAMNGPSWSLSCEFFFYLMFPLFFAAVRRLRATWLWWAVGVTVALIAGAFLVAQFLVTDQPRLTIFFLSGTYSFTQIWFVYFLPPVRALEFVLGMLLARIVLAGRWPAFGVLPAAAVAVAGYLVALVAPYLAGTGGLASIWTAPLIAAAAVSDWRGTATGLRGRVLVRLGELSFAFYLVHWIVIMTAARLLGPQRAFPQPVGYALIAVLLAVSLLLAWVLHTVVEDPVVRRFSRPRTEERAPERAVPAGSGRPDDRALAFTGTQAADDEPHHGRPAAE